MSTDLADRVEGLAPQELAELSWLAHRHSLVWGGVYERGGDYEVNRMVERGLIEPVAHKYKSGRFTYSGGYRITPAGRAALLRAKEADHG